MDQTVLFKQRNEDTGTDHAVLRMNPANQSFRSEQNRRIGTDIKLRLVVNLELMLLDGFGKVLNQLLGKEVLFMQMTVIPADGLGQVAAHGV